MQISESSGYDYLWENPSEAQLAAIDIVSMLTPDTKASRLLCDFIIFAHTSPWFYEIKRYSQSSFVSKNGEENIDTFVQGCKNIVELINSGYNETAKKWWYLGDIDTQEEVIRINKFLFMLANSLIVIQDSFAKERKDAWIVFQVETFANLVLGFNWRKNFYGAVEDAKKTIKKEKRNGNKK